MPTEKITGHTQRVDSKKPQTGKKPEEEEEEEDKAAVPPPPPASHHADVAAPRACLDRKTTRKQCVSAALIYASICLIVALGALTLTQVRTERVTARLKDRLADLNNDFILSGFTDFQIRTASLIWELSNGTVFTPAPPNPGADAYELFSDFEHGYRRAKRRVPLLRDETRREYQAFERAYFDLVDQRARTAGDARVRANVEDDAKDAAGDDYSAESIFIQDELLTTPAPTSDVYSRRLSSSTTERRRSRRRTGRHARVLQQRRGVGTGPAVVAYQDAHVEYRDAIDDVQRRAETSLTALACTLGAHESGRFEETVKERERQLLSKSDELEIQRKILSQFSHEMRNKYSAATHMLEHVQALASATPREANAALALRDELVSMHDDVTRSLALLHEADALVATRLTLHKIYSGTYSTRANLQTVDLRTVLQLRVDVARPFADPGVDFGVEIPVRYHGCDVAVRLDLYIFTHLANNLLSNARKATARGSVTLAFLGAKTDSAFCDDDLDDDLDDDPLFGVGQTTSGSPARRNVVGSGECAEDGVASPAGTTTTQSQSQSQSQQHQPHVGGGSRRYLSSTATSSSSTAVFASSRLVFGVRDTGKGVPATIADRLFQEEVHSGDARGVGLGLVSCKRFAEAIGGDVWLESSSLRAPDDPTSGGADFRFSLPGKIVSVAPAAPDDALSGVHLYATAASHHSGGRDAASGQREATRETRSTQDDDSVASSAQTARLKLPAAMLGIVVEDSQLIRRTICAKLGAVGKRTRTEFRFVEHDTVEAFYAAGHRVDDANLLITVDENLDAAGGHLCGRDLVAHLVEKQFRGILASVTGDDESAQLHRELGADITWTKPLPRVEVMVADLNAAFDLKNRLACSVRSTIERSTFEDT